MPNQRQHLRPISNQDTGASWSPRQRRRGGIETPTNLEEIRYHRTADG